MTHGKGYWMYPWWLRAFWRAVNWFQGYGWKQVDDWHHGAAPFVRKHGTCPYPLHPDVSMNRCISNGDCGCDRLP